MNSELQECGKNSCLLPNSTRVWSESKKKKNRQNSIRIKVSQLEDLKNWNRGNYQYVAAEDFIISYRFKTVTTCWVTVIRLPTAERVYVSSITTCRWDPETCPISIVEPFPKASSDQRATTFSVRVQNAERNSIPLIRLHGTVRTEQKSDFFQTAISLLV